MALEKKEIDNFLPNGFETLNQEGYKENFSDDMIQTGYEKDVPDLVSGPNLNNLIDKIGKNTNTLNNYVNYLNSLSINKTPIIDSNNQLNSTQIGLKVYSATETYLLNDLVTTIQDEKVLFYKSLVANNTGNPLTNTDYWEKIELGGGSGVELCTILCMPFGIDESENKYRYLNGQTIVQSQYPAFTAKIKSWQSTRANLFTTEEEWQAIKTASKLSQCGKFVIDDEAGTIRLPAIVNINGLTDLSKCGLIKDESLPAHKHTRGTMEITGSFAESKLEQYEASGAFYYDGSVGSNSQAADGGGKRIRFSAARTWKGTTSAPDNATYQDGAPVQQEAVQYPYVICVNTGVEEAERPINNYQVNNTNSYGDNKYVGNTILNNLSWSRSIGQENSGTISIGFYNWAVANIGQPFGAGYIKENSATDITDYDLVINKSKQTFILPTLNGEENIMSTKYSAMNINGSPYNFTAPANGWLYMSGTAISSNNEYVTVYIDKAKTTPIIGRSPLTNMSITYLVPVFKGQEVIIEYTASNISRCKFIYAKGNGNLYYYVGDTLQNADLINIARMQEELVNKVDKKQAGQASMPSDKYIDLTLGANGTTYIAPADGYFYIRKFSTSVNQFIGLYGVVSSEVICSLQNFDVAVYVPAAKGQSVTCFYSLAGETKEFRFVYAVGSEPST